MDTKDKIATIDETIERVTARINELSESIKKFQCELDTATEEYDNLLLLLRNMVELRDVFSGKKKGRRNYYF